MSLSEKCRPKDFDEIVGNEDAIATLTAHFEQPEANWSHAWLFSGSKGGGKTTLARILANNYFKATEHGIIEMNTANNRGIEAFRELLEKIQFKPLSGKAWVIIVDEAHGLTNDARDCMLKPTEDAPANVFYIFCTTSPDKFSKGEEGKALLSRCKHIKVEPLKSAVMFRMLRGITKREKKVLPDEVLQYIADTSEGSSRKGLNTLESVMNLEDPEMMMRVIATGASEAGTPEAFDFCKALMTGSFGDCAKILASLKKSEVDAESVRRAVLGYFTTVGLSGNSRARIVLEAFMPTTYDSGYSRLVLSTMQAFNK